MKINYEKPIIKIEEFERVDILLISEQTDNKHIGSKMLIDRNFNLESIL